MADEIQPVSTTDAVCPWCSAWLASPDLARCPSCGAILSGESVESVPGVTAVDVNAITRGAPTTVRSRNRLLSWINGDYPEDVQNADEAKALEPPDPAVRREMLRLELQAEVASLKAQADALVAEAAAEGRVVTPPDVSTLASQGVTPTDQGVTPTDQGVTPPEAVLPGDDAESIGDPPA